MLLHLLLLLLLTEGDGWVQVAAPEQSELIRSLPFLVRLRLEDDVHGYQLILDDDIAFEGMSQGEDVEHLVLLGRGETEQKKLLTSGHHSLNVVGFDSHQNKIGEVEIPFRTLFSSKPPIEVHGVRSVVIMGNFNMWSSSSMQAITNMPSSLHADALQDLGLDVYRIEETENNHDIARIAVEIHLPDLFLYIPSQGLLDQGYGNLDQVWETCRKFGIPSVVLIRGQPALLELQGDSELWSSDYVVSSDASGWLAKIRGRARHVLLAGAAAERASEHDGLPRSLPSCPLTHLLYDVVVPGMNSRKEHVHIRNQLVRVLRDRLPDLRIRHEVAGVDGETLGEALRCSKLVLLLSPCSPFYRGCSTEGYWDENVFNVIAQGGLVFHNKVQGRRPRMNASVRESEGNVSSLGHDLEDGRHVVLYDLKNSEDLVQKIRYYVENKTSREFMRRRAYWFVMQRHTLKTRMEEMLGHIQSLEAETDSWNMNTNALTPNSTEESAINESLPILQLSYRQIKHEIMFLNATRFSHYTTNHDLFFIKHPPIAEVEAIQTRPNCLEEDEESLLRSTLGYHLQTPTNPSTLETHTVIVPNVTVSFASHLCSDEGEMLSLFAYQSTKESLLICKQINQANIVQVQRALLVPVYASNTWQHFLQDFLPAFMHGIEFLSRYYDNKETCQAFALLESRLPSNIYPILDFIIENDKLQWKTECTFELDTLCLSNFDHNRWRHPSYRLCSSYLRASLLFIPSPDLDFGKYMYGLYRFNGNENPQGQTFVGSKSFTWIDFEHDQNLCKWNLAPRTDNHQYGEVNGERGKIVKGYQPSGSEIIPRCLLNEEQVVRTVRNFLERAKMAGVLPTRDFSIARILSSNAPPLLEIAQMVADSSFIIAPHGGSCYNALFARRFLSPLGLRVWLLAVPGGTHFPSPSHPFVVDPVKVVKVLSAELRTGNRGLDSMIASVSCNLSIQVEISVAMRLFRDLQLYAEINSSYAGCILSLEVDGVVVDQRSWRSANNRVVVFQVSLIKDRNPTSKIRIFESDPGEMRHHLSTAGLTLTWPSNQILHTERLRVLARCPFPSHMMEREGEGEVLRVIEPLGTHQLAITDTILRCSLLVRMPSPRNSSWSFRISISSSSSLKGEDEEKEEREQDLLPWVTVNLEHMALESVCLQAQLQLEDDASRVLNFTLFDPASAISSSVTREVFRGCPSCPPGTFFEDDDDLPLPPRRCRQKLVYVCKGGCGGMGDRMIGMLNVYLLSVVLNRCFRIHSIHPDYLERWLVPNDYDWRVDPDAPYDVLLSWVNRVPEDEEIELVEGGGREQKVGGAESL
ncbi:hypothetical protein GUITHDRAFT_143268 [Guillardia theta CCMP2712]|uniref:Spore protein YkvP/CgeB glycosyl transferase-like domain-containing protein n=1 Tax=Guillardia theta (strain CCMP2712) TaxID=905079 RepID=L1ITV9_GUITC|nr:hypothetical protein GUITHDRAFT_143268 [Guillardia theta CCMP2712]EKX39678.1 hypothetical protein GUITHDRAFT_143268 [Guillardia theta CCMP2712]|eukprot:XP_005826658.1 hypothetical protein GUITHDRAFT_143268 [Guillardia theta CCMP2712]